MHSSSANKARLWLPVMALALVITGCELEKPSEQPREKPEKKEKEPQKPTKRAQIGKNLFLEIQGDTRRVLVHAEVCMRRGPLELLLTKKRTKEHEAILAADVDAKELKRALLVAKAKAGHPVQFEPKYQPVSGQIIKVTLAYEEKGRLKTVRAQDWITNIKTKKPLKSEWVFGGSQLVPNPLDPQNPVFLADEGDYICISNFESALIDLPIKISKVNSMLQYECRTKLIPKEGTPVTVILEPGEMYKADPTKK